MIYRHQYFKLDTETEGVYDGNGKRLQLTDLSYRMLWFLCENKKATVDEMGDFLYGESEKFYDYNTIRQHKYKINKLISYNVIEYKSPFFFLVGGIEKVKEDQIDGMQSQEGLLSLIEKDSWSGIDQGASFFGRKTFFIIVAVIFGLLVFGLMYFKPNHKDIVKSENPEVEIIRPQDDMVLITAGEFLMGSTEKQAFEAFSLNKSGYEKESYLAEYPQRKIDLPNFFIDRYETSNDDYALFAKAENRKLPEVLISQELNAPNQPVVGVDWNESDAYCRWVGKRLPTEAEWEKAARGTDGRIWPWGNSWNPKKDNHGNGKLYGLDESDGYIFSAPVGSELGVSPYGVFNMVGNVYEWVNDDFDLYPGNEKYSYILLNKGTKVMKGGAFDDGLSEHRPASRIGWPKDFRGYDFGFRCAKDAN